VEAATPAKKNAMPVIAVRGAEVVEAIHKFSQAYEASKEAEAVLKEYRPVIEERALVEFFKENAAHPTTPISSIKLETETGATVRFTFQEKYSVADAATVEALFEKLNSDAGAYVTETLKPSFNANFFNNADGEFDEAVYNATVAALEGVARQFGKTNPLATKKIVVPKPNFHAERFSKFDINQNVELTAVLPNTRNVVPV